MSDETIYHSELFEGTFRHFIGSMYILQDFFSSELKESGSEIYR